LQWLSTTPYVPDPAGGRRPPENLKGGRGIAVTRLVPGLLIQAMRLSPEVFTVRRILRPVMAVVAVVLLPSVWPADLLAQRRSPRVQVVRPAVVVSAQYYRPFFWQRYPYPYPYPYPYAYRVDHRAALRIEGPRDAEVYVNGYFVGTVDDFNGFLQRLHLDPGEHEIAVFLEGFRTRREVMLLRPRETYRLRVELQPLAPGDPPDTRPSPAESAVTAAPRAGRVPVGRYGGRADVLGTLSILVQPAGAAVFIDGTRWEWPSEHERLVVEVPEGRRWVEVQLEGHQPYSTTVTVRRGEVTTLNVSLPRQ
jgi:hypothetical protein